MKEFIKQMYQAIQEGDVNLFDDIEDKIKKGDIELTIEDVVPLCKMIIIDSEYIEYSQIIEIARMTLWAVETHNMQEGFKEYVKGLEEIYDEGQKSTWKNWYNYTCEDFLDRYIGMTLLRYKEEDIALFGKEISENGSVNFKLVIAKILKRIMGREEENKECIIKGEILKKVIERSIFL